MTIPAGKQNFGPPAAFDQARTLEMAQKHSESYVRPVITVNVAAIGTREALETPMEANAHMEQTTSTNTATSTAMNAQCFFCGYNRHHHSKCPAKDSPCNS